MNRRRMYFEAMRDSTVFVGGGMDERQGGQSTDLLQKPYSSRRAVYGKVVRQNIPGVFRTFDVANPSIHSPNRPETTVPQQALFAMNSDLHCNKLVQQQHLSSLSRNLWPSENCNAYFLEIPALKNFNLPLVTFLVVDFSSSLKFLDVVSSCTLTDRCNIS